MRLAREIEERQRRGQALDGAEIQALEEELEAIAEEAAPHYEELERQVEELTRQLEPAREQMRTLSVELRREVDAWRLRHATLLRELEEDGVTVPSYEEEPGREDEPESDSESDEPDA
jgi:nitrate/nitrite-specific signal transduction histidine kinase